MNLPRKLEQGKLRETLAEWMQRWFDNHRPIRKAPAIRPKTKTA